MRADPIGVVDSFVEMPPVRTLPSPTGALPLPPGASVGVDTAVATGAPGGEPHTLQ
jgi:hypothetical protein